MARAHRDAAHLAKAWEAQKATPTLTGREVEQAVVATFLHSQPAGQAADQADLPPPVSPAGRSMSPLHRALPPSARRSTFAPGGI